MQSRPLDLQFSFSAADDAAPVGARSPFGFVTMLRLNLVQALARRGIEVVTPRVDDDAGGATFGTLLRQHRIDAGLSQETLAERARISVNGLSALERGVRKTPHRETLALLTDALNLSDTDRSALEASAGRGLKPEAARSDAGVVGSAQAIIIVVATPAWYASTQCREAFARVEAGDGVIVVRRETFEPQPAIAAIEASSRFDFFRHATHARPGEPLYRNDGSPAAAFYDVVDALAQEVARKLSLGAAASSEFGDRQAVYVAPPASDMEAPYRTLVAELQSAGYVVLPAPGAVSLDRTDDELAHAVASLHLLGENDEFDNAGRSLVSFPLARAAARVRNSHEAFRRIIFAPKFVSTGDRVDERDPIEVWARFAEPLESDKIAGDGIVDFVPTVRDLVRAAARPTQTPAQLSSLSEGQAVFVNFHPDDVPYAKLVAKALRQRGLRARFAAFEGDKITNKIANAELLRESQAVIHCWALASDAWLYAEAADHNDWRKFGRTQPFHTRAAIAGPPERGSKLLYSQDDPPEAIDMFLDLTMRECPLASDLDPIVTVVNESRIR